MKMTLYECSSLIVSALALALSLLIPFCQFIHRKSQKTKLEIIPFDGYPLTLYFDKAGSTLDFKFSLSCSKKDCVIRSMKARIWNYSGPTTTFDWDTLNPINLSWANAGMQQIKMATAELVHPLLLKRDSLTPLNVHFAREDDSWSKLFKEHGEKPPCIPEPLLSEQIANELLWNEGDFVLTIVAFYDTDKEFSTAFGFSVNANHAERLRNNSFVIASNDAAAKFPNPYFAMLKINDQ